MSNKSNLKSPLLVKSNKAIKTLLEFNSSKALHQFPLIVDRNRCFVVNIVAIGEDFNDGNSWRSTSGARTKYYSVEGEGDKMKIDSGKSGRWYAATPIRHHHSTDKSVHRVIICLEDSEGKKSDLAIVQYRFEGTPHTLDNMPHGNARNDPTPFVPTKKSVLNQSAEAIKL